MTKTIRDIARNRIRNQLSNPIINLIIKNYDEKDTSIKMSSEVIFK